MLWMLTLHIIMLLIWCASLLFLLGVLVDSCPSHRSTARYFPVGPHNSLVRLLFTWVATPAALLAIASGTAVFLVARIIEPWLMIKLTLVTLVVTGHVLSGLLVLRREAEDIVYGKAALLLVALLALMITIVWLVLAKPQEWPV